MELSYIFLFNYFLIRFSKVCFAEVISNLGFSIDADDDCKLYRDWCIESSGYSSNVSTHVTYGPNETCNITIVYGTYANPVELWPVGQKYEVEVGLSDYFTIDGKDFSDYCSAYKGGERFWVWEGTTIYWQTNGLNEYTGWRFCIQNMYDPYSYQEDWLDTCECSGEDPLSNGYGSYCDYHTYNHSWCYSDADVCEGYRACFTSGDRVTWFYCEMSVTPTTIATAAPSPYPTGVGDSVDKKSIALFGLCSLICVPLCFVGLCYWRKVRKLNKDLKNDELSIKEPGSTWEEHQGIKRSSSLQLEELTSKEMTIKMRKAEWENNLTDTDSSSYLKRELPLDEQLELLSPYVFTDKLTNIVRYNRGSRQNLTVWLAHGPEESMKFFVKQFKEWKNMSEQEKPAIIHEIKHMINLKHKNIVRCFGFLQNPIKVVYEFCEQGSYIDMRNQGRSKMLPIEDRIKILIHACRGLIYLVTKRILHRDIAARNILLDKHLTAKVANFERSHVLQEGEKVYTCNDLVGSLIRWTAPEILRRGESSEASDVWAFGVTMWEVLTDQEPYNELEQKDIEDAVLYDGFRLDLSYIRQELLRNLLSKCWDQDPNDRHKMKDIVNLLTLALEDVVKKPSVCSYDLKDPETQIINYYVESDPRPITTIENDSGSTQSSRLSMLKITTADESVVYSNCGPAKASTS